MHIIEINYIINCDKLRFFHKLINGRDAYMIFVQEKQIHIKVKGDLKIKCVSNKLLMWQKSSKILKLQKSFSCLKLKVFYN